MAGFALYAFQELLALDFMVYLGRRVGGAESNALACSRPPQPAPYWGAP